MILAFEYYIVKTKADLTLNFRSLGFDLKPYLKDIDKRVRRRRAITFTTVVVVASTHPLILMKATTTMIRAMFRVVGLLPSSFGRVEALREKREKCFGWFEKWNAKH